VHTGGRIVDNEFGEQWKAFAHLWTQAMPSAPAGSAPAGRPEFAFASFANVAERFTAAARAYVDGVARASAPGLTDPARVFGDVLRELFADSGPLWNFTSGIGPGMGTGAPALGATREHQLRAQRMADAWRRLNEAQRRLQRLWSDALRDAASSFTARIGPPQSTAPSAEAVRALYDQWIDCAEDAYSQAAHSETFCDTLADHVNASSEWRRELRASIEHAANILDLPTRSEINTLTQRLRAVEKELRAVRAERDRTHSTKSTKRTTTPTTSTPKTRASKRRPARRRVKP
jgi:polyhydroxyalkanoate synthesis regulator phasin